jgi:hypothetical protein
MLRCRKAQRMKLNNMKKYWVTFYKVQYADNGSIGATVPTVVAVAAGLAVLLYLLAYIT